jgi:hypothetical protein
MVNQTQSATTSSSVTQSTARPPDTQSLAAGIIANNSQGGRRDIAAIKADLAAINAQNPASAGALSQAIDAQLTPVERGQLASSTSLAQAPGGPSVGTLALDITQIGLDIVGIFEPTPFADGANTLISLGRGDWLGAGLSVLGVVPYIGDLAKLGKLGKWAKTIANGVELAAKNPAAAKILEPALRKVHDALKAIPEGALKKLPDDAREAIQGMKKQLDEFFGAANKKLSDIPVSQLDRSTLLTKLDTLDVSTKPNTATFYSGRGSRQAAEAHAAANGRITLETTAGGRQLDDMRLFDGTVKDVNGDAAMEIWGKVSTNYAEQASGRVMAFVNGPKPGGVFLTQELPALLNNAKVTDIVVRGGSGAEIVIPKGTSLETALEMIGKLK